MDPVVHFEVPGEDLGRMKKFYENAFGWQMKQMGEDMGNYVVVQTGETDEKGMLWKPGMINGGFYQKSKENNLPSVVIAVRDIRQAMQKIKDAGGQVVGGAKPGEPDDIPGVGLYISFTDTEGNRLSILQPKDM